MPEEPQIEGRKRQDDAGISHQPLPEQMSEEHEIYSDYDGYHRGNAEDDNQLSVHFKTLALVSSAWISNSLISFCCRVACLWPPDPKAA